jgi:hypothetical protein
MSFLGNPGMAGGHREAEEYGFFAGTLGDDGKSVVEIFEDILAGEQCYLPLLEGARG